MADKELKTHYRRNTGKWRDSGDYDYSNLELTGTPDMIADEINKRLQNGQKVTVVELGAMWATDITAVASRFKDEIKAGKLQVVLTDKEQFNPKTGITGGYRKNTLSRLNIDPELPDNETAKFLEANEHLTTRIPGVETEQLPRILEREGIGRVDVVVEHFGGLFHARNQKKAVEAVKQSLKPDGIVVTSEYLEDRNKYGDVLEHGLRPEQEHKWRDISKVYRKAE